VRATRPVDGQYWAASMAALGMTARAATMIASAAGLPEGSTDARRTIVPGPGACRYSRGLWRDVHAAGESSQSRPRAASDRLGAELPVRRERNLLRQVPAHGHNAQKQAARTVSPFSPFFIAARRIARRMGLSSRTRSGSRRPDGDPGVTSRRSRRQRHGAGYPCASRGPRWSTSEFSDGVADLPPLVSNS